ncbi:cyclic peptide export ABC transporter [Janthinobacterium sp. SUN211]|uniref:cyclic peptide export ABC transporter n=1 Tax=Janthinobacterium sp. SUN211 TaxID=3014786 RepID=UPI002712A110|nr:cyclic peptide export ABC transporter [Janthinobacterium sp. SUN211]MDO8052398.1 cyclic peptide export ABC transporter [Janthinobacterium sp. SUN211]
MNLFSLLAKNAPNKVFFSIIVGILSGVVYSLLIPLVMASLDGGDALEGAGSGRALWFGMEITNPSMALIFTAALLFIWASRTWVDITMTRVSMAATSELRIQMYYRIAHAPLAAIEKIGLPRLVTAIASDMPAVVTGAQTAQTMLIDMVTLIGMLSFLAYVHTAVFWFVLKCIIFGVLSYQLIFVFADRYFFRVAKINDSLQRSVHGLMHGFKELKLSDDKRHAYFKQALLATESELLAAQRPGNNIHSAAANYGLMLNFLFLGSIAFIFVSYHSLSAQSLSSIMMVMLYISMPIGSVTSKIPGFTYAKVAIGRVNALLAELPQEPVAQEAYQARAWDSVRFEHVVYEHEGEEGAGFAVGPINLEFCKGEITFIVGGNGSGKSTLSKLLTLHYHASGGAIYFGGQRITNENMNSYRQSICAIYSDYYLFDRILAAGHDQDKEEKVEYYLKQLGLDKKVNYHDGRFSTLSLSDGQRRRMALVAAFVEDRELYLFDEWAADQDPSFKDIFYREILPSLKAKGKAVVVISHDDRYFDVADKLIVMCEGQLQSSNRPAGLLSGQARE